MKMGAKIKLDLSKIKDLDDFYTQVSDAFGFPDFFGRNIHALIDCLSSLRTPEDGMTQISIKPSQYLLLEVIDFSSASEPLKNTLLNAVESVNLRCQEMQQNPSIFLLLN